MNSYSGVSKGRMRIVAMHSPYRKKLGLFIYDEHSNTYCKVATFNNDESAQTFIEYLARFVNAKMEVEDA